MSAIRSVLALLLAVSLVGVAWADETVRIDLPRKPTVTLRPESRLVIASFEGRDSELDLGLAVAEEAAQFWRGRQEIRERRVENLAQVREALNPLAQAGASADRNAAWAILRERLKADYLLLGSYRFQILNEPQYRREPVIDPKTGYIYYRETYRTSNGSKLALRVRLLDLQAGRELFDANVASPRLQEEPDLLPSAQIRQTIRRLYVQIHRRLFPPPWRQPFTLFE